MKIVACLLFGPLYVLVLAISVVFHAIGQVMKSAVEHGRKIVEGK